MARKYGSTSEQLEKSTVHRLDANSRVVREQHITVDLDAIIVEDDVDTVKVTLSPSQGRPRTITFPAGHFRRSSYSYAE